MLPLGGPPSVLIEVLCLCPYSSSVRALPANARETATLSTQLKACGYFPVLWGTAQEGGEVAWPGL